MRKTLFTIFMALVLLVGTLGISPVTTVHAEDTFTGAYGISYTTPGWIDGGSGLVSPTTFDGTARRWATLSWNVQGDHVQYYRQAFYRVNATTYFADANPKHIYYHIKVTQLGATNGVFNSSPSGVYTGQFGGETFGDMIITPGGLSHRWDYYADFTGIPIQPGDLYGIHFQVDITVSLDPIVFPFVSVPTIVYIDPTESNGGANDALWVARLPAYFAEMNYFLRDTNRRMIPPTSVQVVTSDPFNFSQVGCNYFGNEAVKIWFSTTGGAGGLSTDGYSVGRDCDGYGTIVVNTMGLNIETSPQWVIPDRANIADGLGSTQYYHFTRTVAVLLHELVHTFGGFAVELYDYDSRIDPSGLAPIQDVIVTNANDPWWNGTFGGVYNHLDFRPEPMHQGSVGWGGYFSDFHAALNLSTLSKEFIDGPWRDTSRSVLNILGKPSVLLTGRMFSGWNRNLGVVQLDAGGRPVPNITVKAWYLGDINPFAIHTTDANGYTAFDWAGDPVSGTPESAGYDAVLLKSYAADGSVWGNPQIVDIYNLQQKMFSTGSILDGYSVTMSSPRIQSYVLTAPAVYISSGKVTELSQGSGTGGSHGDSILQVGDTAANQGIRSIIQIDTSALPDNAIIDSATLNVVASSIGGSLANFGPVGNRTSMNTRIGIPCIGLCQLQNGDWQQTGVADIGTMGPLVVGGVLVPSQHLTFTTNLNYISKTGYTEFRLQFSQATDADGVIDRVNLVILGGTDAPTLTVVYHLP